MTVLAPLTERTRLIGKTENQFKITPARGHGRTTFVAPRDWYQYPWCESSRNREIQKSVEVVQHGSGERVPGPTRATGQVYNHCHGSTSSSLPTIEKMTGWLSL